MPMLADRRPTAGCTAQSTQRQAGSRPEPKTPAPPADLASQVDLVVGVDTHTDTHTAAICDARGGLLSSITVTADDDGFGQLLDAVLQAVAGLASPRIAWAIEGTGSYGAALAQMLHEAGQQVLEVTRARRPRGQGKNDLTDAVAIARNALTRTAPGQPRRGNVREALRLIHSARATDVAHRTRLINRFKAVLITAPEPVRDRLRGLDTTEQLAAAARMRGPRVPTGRGGQPDLAHTDPADLPLLTAITVLRQTAAQIADLDKAIAAADKKLDQLTRTHAPALRAEHGIGPVIAAAVLIAYSHPGRLHSDAAMAKLAGICPLEASSGRTIRHRLNRTGDRQLNAAIHRIVITRRRTHPATQAYIARRTTEGKTDKEINRCLKRAIIRHLYRQLETMPAMP